MYNQILLIVMLLFSGCTSHIVEPPANKEWHEVGFTYGEEQFWKANNIMQAKNALIFKNCEIHPYFASQYGNDMNAEEVCKQKLSDKENEINVSPSLTAEFVRYEIKNKEEKLEWKEFVEKIQKKLDHKNSILRENNIISYVLNNEWQKEEFLLIADTFKEYSHSFESLNTYESIKELKKYGIYPRQALSSLPTGKYNSYQEAFKYVDMQKIAKFGALYPVQYIDASVNQQTEPVELFVLETYFGKELLLNGDMKTLKQVRKYFNTDPRKRYIYDLIEASNKDANYGLFRSVNMKELTDGDIENIIWMEQQGFKLDDAFRWYRILGQNNYRYLLDYYRLNLNPHDVETYLKYNISPTEAKNIGSIIKRVCKKGIGYFSTSMNPFDLEGRCLEVTNLQLQLLQDKDLGIYKYGDTLMQIKFEKSALGQVHSVIKFHKPIKFTLPSGYQTYIPAAESIYVYQYH